MRGVALAKRCQSMAVQNVRNWDADAIIERGEQVAQRNG